MSEVARRRRLLAAVVSVVTVVIVATAVNVASVKIVASATLACLNSSNVASAGNSQPNSNPSSKLCALKLVLLTHHPFPF